MARKVMPLTEVKIRNMKPADKDIKLFDGDGLFLLMKKSGGKLWRLKYRYDGKEKLLSLGSYPDVGLSDARKRRDAARELLAQGFNPSTVRQEEKATRAEQLENTFEAIAREWHTKNYSTWVKSYADQIMRRLKNDIFPVIGERPIVDLKASDVLKAIRPIEKRGAVETAHRIKQVVGMIFRYAVATSRAERDPTGDLKGALAKVHVTHHAAITEPAKVGELLRAIESYDGSLVVRCALRISPLVFVRPGELRKAVWSEINFDESLWLIPEERMKMRQPHLVPLSTQAVAILRELHAVTGSRQYLFPSARSVTRPMSNMALQAAIRRLGYEQGDMTPHGFRAMARTILDEVLQERPDLIEHQLAHAVRDPLGRAYNRTKHLRERKRMMQRWADYLDELKKSE